jgi:hypothetical protein
MVVVRINGQRGVWEGVGNPKYGYVATAVLPVENKGKEI